MWAGDTEVFTRCNTSSTRKLLLSGCTTAADHHYVFPNGLKTPDIQAAAAEEIAVRVTLTRGSMNLAGRGRLAAKICCSGPRYDPQDSARVIDALHNPQAGSMIQIALAPCSPLSVTPEIMSDTAALAAQSEVRMHTHLAETADENAFYWRSSDVVHSTILNRLAG